MPLVRWTLTDPVDSSTYEFDMNPSEGGSPSYQKNFTYLNASGAGGSVLAFEGRDSVQEIEVSGTLKTEAHFNALVTWFQKRHAVQVSDDLGRSYDIYITGFTPTRRRSYVFPWKHDYVLRYIVIDW